MIETTPRQKKSLKQIDASIARIQSQLDGMTMQRSAYLLSIIEGQGVEGEEYELNAKYNLEIVEKTED